MNEIFPHTWCLGPEKHVFTWNLDKKLVMTSFRKVEAGQPVYVLDSKSSGETERAGQATDMITFRCANELCDNFFPLKVCIGHSYIKNKVANDSVTDSVTNRRKSLSCSSQLKKSLKNI